MKHIKRTISTLLVLVMVLGMLPVAALAAEEPAQETVPAETAVEETVPVTEATAEETVPAETLTVEVSHEQETMDVGQGLPALAFYSSPNPSPATLITEFGADPDGENVFYFAYNRYGDVEPPTWLEPIDGTFVLNDPDKATVEKLSDLVYKITLNESANDDIAGKGEGETWDFVAWHSAICHWYHPSQECWYEEETTGAAHLILYNAYPEKSYDTLAGAYLTFGWLRNDGDGWYEDTAFEAGGNQHVGLMPGQEQYLIFYLNVYTSGIGSELNRIPVHVQLSQPGSMNFQQLSSSEIRSGEANGEYFYRVTTDTWDQQLGIMDVENGIGGVTAHTNRFEMCAYTSNSMSNSTCVPVCYVADVSQGAENVLYVGLDSDWNAQSMTVDYGADLITLEDTGSQNVKRVVITGQGMENLRKGWDVYVAVKAQNGSREAYANFRITPNPATLPDEEHHEPYLSVVWLDNYGDGEGWQWNPENQPHQLSGHTSTSRAYCLYFLNVWNEETGEYGAVPVIPEGNGEDIFITPMSSDPESFPVKDGEEFGDYFVETRIGGNLYYDQSELYVTYNGEKLTIPMEIYGREIAFYSQPEAKPEYLLEGHQSLKYGEENAYYIVLLSPQNFTVENFKWYVHSWEEDYNQFVSDGQFLDFEDMGNGVWKFTVDPEYVEYTKQPNPNWIWKNFNLVFECDLKYNADGSIGHWAQDIWINPAETNAPYLSVVWLDNYGDGEGWQWNPENQPHQLSGHTSTSRAYCLYFLNVWNEETGAYEAVPVIPEGNGEDIFITPMSSDPESFPVKDGEEFGDYYVETRIGGNLYYDQSEIYVTYNGEKLTLPMEIYGREIAFYSQPEAKPEYLLEGHQDLKYGEENVYYVALLQPDYYTAENFKWYVHTWDEDYNQFVSDGQFIDFEQVNKGLWKFTIDPEYVEYTKQPNPNGIWKNFNLVFECDLRHPDGGDGGHWAQDIWVNPAAVPTSGSCGGTLTWEFDPETGTLTIKGIGEMFDFIISILKKSVNVLNAADPTVPWAAYQSQIKQVILPEGLTNIGNNAFAGCENLTEITIPKTVTAVGSGAFVNCSGLKEVSFQGNAPEVAENAFENVEATITYPQDNETWTEDKMQDFGGALTWAPETGHEYQLGDVNHDGKINAKDATLILQKSVGVLKDTAKFCEECAEVSGDGKLNAKDSTLILQFSVGLRDSFPAQK